MTSADTAVERTQAVPASTPIHIWLALLRHHVRLLAPSSIAWIIGLVAAAALVTSAYASTMPTVEDRQALARTVEGNPAFEAMFGRAIALDTIEGFTMWRAGGPLIPAIVIWGMLAATRLGRGEEDKGHDELILGGVLSRQALLVSALAALVIVITVYVALTAQLLLAVSEISQAGSWRFALAMAGGFTFFAALGALLVQITPSRSVAVRIGLGLIGVALGLRILSVVEQMPGWLPWLTPFGWFAEIGPPGAGSNVPFLLFGLGTIVFGVTAVELSRRREIHGSLLFTEREIVEAKAPYRSLWWHEVNQDLPGFIGFAGVGLLLSAIFGLVANDFIDFIKDFPAFAAYLEGFGMTRFDDPAAYIGLVVMVLVLIVTLYAVGHVAGMREDEASGRLAVLLILPLERHRWLVINALVGVIAIAVISLIIGFGAMIGTAITGAMLDPFDALRAGLNLIPIAVMFVGLGIFLFGVYPSLTGPLLYSVMLVSFLLVLMDAFLDIPSWIISLSPFEYLALVPGEPANLTASAVFLLIGVVGGVIGTFAFRRRDLMMD
jgi:ABC-2 type transport system permease protein